MSEAKAGLSPPGSPARPAGAAGGTPSIGDTDIASRSVSPKTRRSSTGAASPGSPSAAALKTDVGTG